MPETKAVRTRFEHANPILNVANLARSVRYYVDVLGFTNADWGGDDFTCVTRDGASIYLSEGDQGQSGTWVWLGVAGLFEVVWAVLLKYTDGFSRLWPSVATMAAMGVSFYCMSRALQALPIGTVYAIWTGIGAGGAAIWGMAVEGDPATAARIFCLALILGGVAGLKLAS